MTKPHAQFPVVVNLQEKFDRITEFWSPRIAAELNDSYLKLAKLQGEFVWHHQASEDELFLVVRGSLRIELRDGNLTLNEGELVVIPHGVEHRPVAEEEVWVMLLEPRTTLNTGTQVSVRTKPAQWI